LTQIPRAIFEHLDDDAPRLVYADALAERGDPRGELIHVQCALAKTPPGAAADGLRARERELLLAHEREWIADLEPLPVRPIGPSWTFGRGFVEVVELPFRAEPGRLSELAERTPLRGIDLVDDVMGLRCLIQCPEVRDLREIAIRGAPNQDAPVELAVLGRFSSLRKLTIDRCGNEAWLQPLAELPNLGAVESLTLVALGLKTGLLPLVRQMPRLTELRLGGNARLAELPRILALPLELTELDLGAVGEDDPTIDALVDAPPSLAGLQRLRVTGWIGQPTPALRGRRLELPELRSLDLSTGGWSHTLDLGGLPRLRTLDLSFNRTLGNTGRLAEVATLRELRLGSLGIGDQGVAELVASGLPLEWLSLGANRLGRKAALALSKLGTLRALDASENPFDAVPLAGGPSGLVELSLRQTRVDDVTLEALAEAPWVPTLTSLDIARNGFTARGLRAFLARATSLRDLYVRLNPAISNEGARVIAESPAPIQRLDAGECAIGDAGALALATKGTLRWLDLSQNLVGPVGARALADAPVARRLLGLNLRHNPTGDVPELRAVVGAHLLS
jgi:uncharacterized protein (TIGR02996 family)